MPGAGKSWVPVAILLGAGYALVGITFAVPTTHAHAWRLAAWAVSAIGFAAHSVYERVRLQSQTGSAAIHVALAAALGACGLAVGANVHALLIGSSGQQRTLLLVSLVIWPVITGLPAYLVALGTGTVLGRVLGSARRE